MGLKTTTEYEILNSIKNDFDNSWQNGQRTPILDVKIGLWVWDSIQLKPSIAIYCQTINFYEKIQSSNDIKEARFNLYVYLDYDERIDNSWKDVYILKNQIETFLEEDIYYNINNGLSLENNQVVYIGSVDDPAAIASIPFNVKYVG